MRLPVVMATLLCASAGAAEAHEELGVWCLGREDAAGDQPAIYVVSRSDEGKYSLTEKSGDTENVELPLLPVGVNEYAIKGEHSVGGVILRADGMLELYNSQGSIGAASPCDLTND